MTTQGIIYYNRGQSCIVRLMVSIQSLRKFYDGNITILMENYDYNQINWFLEKHKISVINLDSEQLDNTYVRKIIVSQLSPYDKTIFIDADTLIVGNIDELFIDIENYDLCVTQFSNWLSSGKTISRRIKNYKKYLGDEIISKAVSYGPAINTGIYAFIKNSRIFNDWLEIARIGQSNRLYIPDEIACQILLPKYNIKILDSKFNTSVKFGQNQEDKRIIHYHGRKHCRKFNLAELWIKEFINLLHNERDNIGSIIDNIKYDYNLNKFLQYKYKMESYVDECNQIINNTTEYNSNQDDGPDYTNTTIVTACDTKYIECLTLTFPTWIKYKNILKFSIIIYINGFEENDERLDFLKNYKNIKLIPWEMNNADSQREKMLSAFVFGPAKDVNTKYWLKLDCDTYATDSRPILNKDMFGFDVVGHKWNYTKPWSWINTLNEWSLNKNLNFQYLIDKSKIIKNRYYHHRTNSFVQLHSTEFTKQAAELAGEKLPIPSQDTYLWYVATVLNKKILRYSFKKRCGLYNKKTVEQIKNYIAKIEEPENNMTKLHVGCGRKQYRTWINTNKDTLDITDENSWIKNNIQYNSVNRILAEHVFEHLNDKDRISTINNFKKFIHTDGLIRIAVPDGYHPNSDYIKRVDVGGPGASAHDHKFLYNHKTLIQLFELNGFKGDLLEYFDENGQFHFKEWSVEDGFIKRSSRYDRRNKNHKLTYTSLIIDFRKI